MRTVGVMLAYRAEDIKPGWVALVIVLALAVATYLLWRNMNKQLGKINVPTREEVRDAADETPGADDAGDDPPEQDTSDRP